LPVGPVRRDDDTAEFFDAAADGALLIRRCLDCGSAAEPQAVSCPGCRGTSLRGERAAGGATLISWTVCHPRPGSGPDQPAVLAIGELDEGPWWWAALTDADPGELRTGQRLLVAFERAGDHEAVPVFRPADVPAAGDLRP
jgi:uncharacterized OB-fold protein